MSVTDLSVERSKLHAVACPQSKSCESYFHQAFLKSWLSKKQKSHRRFAEKIICGLPVMKLLNNFFTFDFKTELALQYSIP